jgi:hypothetical protein
MKSLVRGCVVFTLSVAVVGCGGAESRVWRGPRLRSGGYATDPMYAPPVDPGYQPTYPAPQPMLEPMPEMAPPVRPDDLRPAPPQALRLQEELPPPPSEEEESVQFIVPVPPTSMPNALYPEDSKPILEQSSAERSSDREPKEVLGEGKIARNMRGHSTFIANQTGRSGVRLVRIEPEQDAAPGLMQVQYLPLLAPVPNL